MAKADKETEKKRNEQKEARDKALKGFDLLDDRMKLNNSIWNNCTRGAFQMGMDDHERMKLIAVNLVRQNGELLDAQVQAGLALNDRDAKIKQLEARIVELEREMQS